MRHSMRWNSPGLLRGWREGLEVAGQLWCFEHTLVVIKEKPYLERWILYWGGRTLRLHKFWRGDDDRASHTHPWAFKTFPLTGYWESVFGKGVPLITRKVAAWRWHARPADFEHIVRGSHAKGNKKAVAFWTPKPFYTIIVTGRKGNSWGFYPKPDEFIPWREWK